MLERNAAGTPLDADWADTYCGGSYDPSVCEAPLFEQALRRDVLGRVRSKQTYWGNPEGGAFATRPIPWRGYEYDLEGRLTTVFEHPGASDPVAPFGLGRHDITNDDVRTFVGAWNANSPEPIEEILWNREADVGAVETIEELSTGTVRWEAGPRGDGHRLTTVTLGNDTDTIGHDAQGRVTAGVGKTMAYGPRGRLAYAEDGGIQENYLYDARGRLMRVIDGKTRTIVWDGVRMIAGMGEDGLPRWEAVWGATDDQLIEYENFDPGTSGRFIPIADHRNAVVGWWDADAFALESIRRAVQHKARCPILHFDMHANDAEIGLSSGDRVSWDDLGDPMRTINQLLGNRLFVSLASCKGAFAAKSFRATRPLFQWVVVGCRHSVISMGYEVFTENTVRFPS